MTKPTFEEYCRESAYPMSEFQSRGLNKLEAFTMAEIEAGSTESPEILIDDAKATLKALYDEQYGKEE